MIYDLRFWILNFRFSMFSMPDIRCQTCAEQANVFIQAVEVCQTPNSQLTYFTPSPCFASVSLLCAAQPRGSIDQRSQLTIHHSLFTIHDSLFTIHDSRFSLMFKMPKTCDHHRHIHRIAIVNALLIFD